MTTHKSNLPLETDIRGGILFEELLSKIEKIDEKTGAMPGLLNGEAATMLTADTPGQGVVKKKKMIDKIVYNINHNVRKRNFEKAIQLREMLFKVDPTAIKEIFKSGQIIESEMYKLELENSERSKYGTESRVYKVNQPQMNRPTVIQLGRSDIDWSDKKIEFMGHWFHFYRKLSDNELIAFTDHLKSVEYDEDTMIITQGMVNNRLFFIGDGIVKNICLEKGARKFEGELTGGDIAGVDTFFDGKVSKMTHLATVGTKVDYIEKEDLYKLISIYPDLERKLKEFCHDNEDDGEMIIVKHYEKRAKKRFQISGLAAAKLLTTSGIPTGKPFRGKMIDISEGGFSFQVKMAEEDNVNMLLGKKIVSLIKVDSRNSNDDVFWGGVIVDVCKRKEQAVSIHLKGDDLSPKVSNVLRLIGT